MSELCRKGITVSYLYRISRVGSSPKGEYALEDFYVVAKTYSEAESIAKAAGRLGVITGITTDCSLVYHKMDVNDN